MQEGVCGVLRLLHRERPTAKGGCKSCAAAPPRAPAPDDEADPLPPLPAPISCPQNKDAGKEALKKCERLLGQYSRCLDRHADLKFYRVQEEYRGKSASSARA